MRLCELCRDREPIERLHVKIEGVGLGPDGNLIMIDEELSALVCGPCKEQITPHLELLEALGEASVQNAARKFGL